MEKMQQSKKDSKKFWKFLDKMEKKADDTLVKEGISDQRWVSHFKGIFNDRGANSPLPSNTTEFGELDQ